MKIRRLPPLHALEAFEIAARESSFQRAAATLHLTTSAVSHQIRALEEHLGVELFKRGNRSLTLTEAGRAYQDTVRDSLARLRDGGRRVVARYAHAKLKLTMGAFVATEIVVPALPEFRARHPGIEVAIDTDVRTRNFAREDMDIALRFGEGRWPSVIAEKLLDARAVPVIAPRLLGRRRSPPPLAQFTRICATPIPQAWEIWAPLAGVDLASIPGEELWLDSFLAQMRAAEQGLGVALGLRPIIDGWLREKRLVAPWPLEIRMPQGYYLAFRAEDADRPEVLAFREWVRELLTKRFG